MPCYLIGTFHSVLFSLQWLNFLFCLFAFDLWTPEIRTRLQDFGREIKEFTYIPYIYSLKVHCVTLQSIIFGYMLLYS